MNEETVGSVGLAEPQRMREPEPQAGRREPSGESLAQERQQEQEPAWEICVANGGSRRHFAAEAGDVTLEEVVEGLKESGMLDPNKRNTEFQLVNTRTSARYRLTDQASATLRELGVRAGDELQVMYDANVAGMASL